MMPDKFVPRSKRCVFNCTLRDSIADFVNMTVWSESDYSAKLFTIGDIIRVAGAKVSTKKSFGDNDRYAPPTPVTIELSLSVPSGVIRLLGSVADPHHLAKLFYEPVRHGSDFFVIAQISRIGKRLENENVNLLAVVKTIGKERHLKSRKDGRDIQCCDIHLLDNTCTDFVLTLWDVELINQAKKYMHRNQICFFTDVTIKYDDKYRKNFYASSSNRTIITPDPNVPDAERLKELVDDDVAEIFSKTNCENENLSVEEISEQFTAEQVERQLEKIHYQSIERQRQSLKSVAFTNDHLKEQINQLNKYGLIFGFLTKLPIGDDIVELVCGSCGKSFDYQEGLVVRQCSNSKCKGENEELGYDSSLPVVREPIWRYRLSVDVSDETGTVKHLWLSDQVAESLFNIPASQMQSLSEQQRCALKWKILFEKFKIFFKIQTHPLTAKTSLCTIDMSPASMAEMYGLAIPAKRRAE